MHRVNSLTKFPTLNSTDPDFFFVFLGQNNFLFEFIYTPDIYFLVKSKIN